MLLKSILIFCLIGIMVNGPIVQGAAIPIWELLTHEEKMGRLFYVFVHLVQQYCKTSDIPDCTKVLTLYGMSNLVNEDEHSLDLMDPYQRDAKTIVWERIMRGEFKLPTKMLSGPNKPIKTTQKVIDNDVYSSPYEVRVRPPADYVAPSPVIDHQESAPSPIIIRLGRSVSEESSLPVLSEQDAEELSQAVL